jgi:hypothetical protein
MSDIVPVFEPRMLFLTMGPPSAVRAIVRRNAYRYSSRSVMRPVRLWCSPVHWTASNAERSRPQLYEHSSISYEPKISWKTTTWQTVLTRNRRKPARRRSRSEPDRTPPLKDSKTARASPSASSQEGPLRDPRSALHVVRRSDRFYKDTGTGPPLATRLQRAIVPE